MTRTAVITGGAGFLGSHLADRLLADGWSVAAFDDLSTGTPENVAHIADNPAFTLIRYDVTRHLHVSRQVSAVLHLASPASPADYGRLPVETLLAGSAGTLNALGLARAHKARFLLASTSEIYGDPQVHPQPEDYRGNCDPVGPRSCYDEAKRYAEALTTAYRKYRGTDTAIARIFNTYGPRMRPHDGRAIPAFIRQAIAGQPLTVTGDGTQTRSFCYVDDLTTGLIRLLESGEPGPVNLGNPAEMTILETAKLIASLVGTGRGIEFIPRPAQDPERRCPDITLAGERLGWKPATSLADGLAETIRWFRLHARYGKVPRP